eukprot:2748832-Pyramimonas_sp.AAC.1
MCKSPRREPHLESRPLHPCIGLKLRRRQGAAVRREPESSRLAHIPTSPLRDGAAELAQELPAAGLTCAS